MIRLSGWKRRGLVYILFNFRGCTVLTAPELWSHLTNAFCTWTHVSFLRCTYCIWRLAANAMCQVWETAYGASAVPSVWSEQPNSWTGTKCVLMWNMAQHDTREPTFSKNARGPGTGTLDARFSVSVVGWKNPEQRYQGSPARPTAISKDQGLLRNDKLTLRMEGGEE